VLALILLWAHLQTNAPTVWMLWATCLVLVVWTCIRQGLRGGSFCAGIASAVVLIGVQFLMPLPPGLQTGIQGNLLAFCSTGLLVGVSASWIRANETRYRQVVSRIPFVVYSVRLPYGIPGHVVGDPKAARADAKVDLHVGPSLCKLANVVLVSPACKQVFGADAEALVGPFTRWLEQVVPEDHELVIAALTQLCLQKLPVTCEYRLRSLASEPAALANQPAARFPAPPNFRFVRDTLTPHYSEDGLMDGWEGLVEDITEQRALSQNLRRMTTMLQVLISNLPTAVYFVQAPLGFPILVNARARQLLGQREDLSTGLAQLSRLFRLHRPDGTEYPWEELPVAKALRLGVACRANDIVLHRPDGRKVPLMTWAAPIDLHGTGTPDAAVWVLEDWTSMHQTELALRESELRLRAIIDTMVEGVMVQDSSGAVIDVNAAACAILGVAREKLLDSAGLAAHGQCVDESGAALSRDQQPDKHALRTGQPVRGATIGLKSDPTGDIRWLLVNSLPLAVSQTLTPTHQRARVVTTFADITQQVKAQEAQRHTRDRYQSLIETLPFMLIQRDQDCNITYMNPAALQLTGHTAEEFFRPGFCESIIHPEDVPLFKAALQTVSQGQSTRIEARFYAKDQTLKTVLAFFNPNFSDGRVVGSTSMVVDMSKQRKLEEELQQAKRLEFVGRLASGTVHDFNNLVQVLMGEAGLAKVTVSEQHPVWQHLSRIEDIGEQASHLAGQILTFSKQRPKQIRPVDLNVLVEQTLRLAKSALPEKIAVATNLDRALPKAQGDEGPLKQVLMNLFLNARDAMPAGGNLTIRTDVAAPPETTPEQAGTSWVHLSIQDTGIGMTENVRRRVFDAFFSTKEYGTGLGLAVVQQIVKELGGVIDVWSEPGVGTRFDVWLVQAS
jgi:PAS domain S-box-containing protein